VISTRSTGGPSFLAGISTYSKRQPFRSGLAPQIGPVDRRRRLAPKRPEAPRDRRDAGLGLLLERKGELPFKQLAHVGEVRPHPSAAYAPRRASVTTTATTANSTGASAVPRKDRDADIPEHRASVRALPQFVRPPVFEAGGGSSRVEGVLMS
jgi:hypothetical protein